MSKRGTVPGVPGEVRIPAISGSNGRDNRSTFIPIERLSFVGGMTLLGLKIH